MDVYQLLFKRSRSFYYFRGWVLWGVCTDFRVYSDVCVVGVHRRSGSTTYKVQPRGHEGVRQTWRALQLIARLRLCRTCMHRTSTLVVGIGEVLPDRTRETVLLEFPPPEIASLPPFSLWPKTDFPRFPLVAEPLTCPSPADIPVLYSRVLQTNFGRSHPKNSNWEGKIHCAHVQAQVLYWEQATEAVWHQICPALRVPVPRSFLHEFFSCFWSSTTSRRQTFGLQLPRASCVSIQRTELMREHDEARRREASV